MSPEQMSYDADGCREAPARYHFRADEWSRIAELGAHSELSRGAGDQHRFSIAEYHALGDAGIIPYDARVELIHGEIIRISPIGYRHARATNGLNEHFIVRARKRFKLCNQTPIHIGEHEPQPDLVLIRPSAAAADRHPVADDIFLLVEVADASLGFDRKTKLKEYARFGIPEVWIVNLRDDVFEVFRRPASAEYAECIVVPKGHEIAPEAFPDLLVPVSDIVG